MQIHFLSAIAAALALLAPMSAYAQSSSFHGQAKLAAPASAPADVKVNGVDWRCDGDTCVGESDRYSSLDGFMRECRKVSAAVGALSAYSSRGRVMSPGDLDSCNQAAPGADKLARK